MLLLFFIQIDMLPPFPTSKKFPPPKLIGLKEEAYHPEIIKYTPAHPHPGFGKDPNIMNAYGHTYYPKWVNGVLVQNKEQEELTNG